MSEPIRFYFRGAVHEVQGAETTQTVLQHLREDLHCTGTKEGCAEGDCGACTVVVGSLVDGKVELKAVNSCIQLTPTLDGKALFTVEDLQQPNGDLHPVQQALVECHGSQCGFCTPGFAMSLWGMYLKVEGRTPERKEIDDCLSGNLCRCTGYRPIIDAARRMTELPAVDFDTKDLAVQLQALKRDKLAVYSAKGQTFFAPRTLAELAQLRADHPAATLLAGSTDVGLWITKQMRVLNEIIYLGHVEEMQYTRVDAASVDRPMLEIGAGVALDDAYGKLCEYYPAELSELRQRFASKPIRNAGTLGGNVANGSPIGDSMPWMIAVGSEVVLHSASGDRVLPMDAFYLDYMKKDMRPGEFVRAMRVPLPRAGVAFRTYKLAKRFDQDISAVCAAYAFEFDGDRIVDARIVYGGMAGTPKRAAETEALLKGRVWDEDAVADAMAALAQDYAPLTDMRASSTYRMRTAQNLLRRFWLETRIDAPLANTDVNAFAA
jgi:xanthine dehydrogenase small subunit